MAPDRKPSVNDGSTEPSQFTRKHLERHDFAKRLYRMILEKGWTQSELARRSGVQRESVSNYVNANTMPDVPNVKKMATALGVKPEDLMPNISEAQFDRDISPSLDVKVSQDDPTRAWVRLNREISMDTFTKIATLLNEEDQSAAKARR
jgi:transcriptional regulator with XRE-family HTH domain